VLASLKALSSDDAAPIARRARVTCASAPPARISAATQIASMISGLAPLRRARRVCPLLQ
jgi:hypothetical protein